MFLYVLENGDMREATDFSPVFKSSLLRILHQIMFSPKVYFRIRIMSTSPRRWTPCWRALARCAQRWQSLGPWTNDEMWERDSIGKTTECQGNNSSSSKNPTNQRLRWSASSGNTTKTTTRLSYISVAVPPSWNPTTTTTTTTKTRPANVSVVVPPSRKSCSVEGHGDGGGKEEQAGQHGNGELK